MTTSQGALLTQACYLPSDGALSHAEQAGTGTPVPCLRTAGQGGVQQRGPVGIGHYPVKEIDGFAGVPHGRLAGIARHHAPAGTAR